MKTSSIIFFGSTLDSLIVLKELVESGYNVQAVVTQPPRPIGRDKIITQTPTEVWAKEHSITVLSFASLPGHSFLYENEDEVINSLSTFKAEVIISASYGQKIPTKTLTDAKYGGLNVHPSLLPRWRGADPIPWTILSGDHQTGATVVSLSEKMDEGKIIAQKKIPITQDDTHIKLREALFQYGAELLVSVLPEYLSGDLKGESQIHEHATTARRLKRDDGFIPWELVLAGISGRFIEFSELPPFFQNCLKYSLEKETTISSAEIIDRAIRSLEPWPGIWSLLDGKRLKILKAHSELHDGKQILMIETVQIEGKNPVAFDIFQKNYLKE